MSPRKQHITATLNNAIKAAWAAKHGADAPCPEEILFVDYLEVPEGTDLGSVDRLVIQMESLWKLAGAAPYDLLIGDEIESNMAQLSSRKTMGEVAKAVTDAMMPIMRTAGKLILADAYLTNRALGLVESIMAERDGSVHMILNTWVPPPRPAYSFDSAADFGDALRANLAAGKRCVAFCGTKKQADKLLERIRADMGDTIRIKYYCRDVAGATMREDFADVGAAWTQCDLLIYTATITCGVRVLYMLALFFVHNCNVLQLAASVRSISVLGGSQALQLQVGEWLSHCCSVTASCHTFAPSSTRCLSNLMLLGVNL